MFPYAVSVSITATVPVRAKMAAMTVDIISQVSYLTIERREGRTQVVRLVAT